MQIFKWMGGANDIEVCHLPDGRVNTSMDWSLAGLGLFRNGIFMSTKGNMRAIL